MKRIIFYVFASISAISFSATPTASPATVTTFGTVSADGFPYSCGKFISDDNKQLWQHWIAGYVSGTNMIRQRQTSTDMDGMYGFVLEYCRKKPMDYILNALYELDKALGPGKQRIDSDLKNK